MSEQESPAPPPPPSGGEDIQGIAIEEEMKSSYLDYAMSVIVSRALPDVRDGLKPVHRRILYAMKESGYEAGKPYRKSARIVGDVMGKYHPHGDQAIYDAMVRMAQDFAMRLPLIDGQGNFGSMDGDRAAAMRYTEARLDRAAHTLLEDIDRETVDFQANYDESVQEPKVLPAGFPNLLVNGAGGIAVGMATNIPPHNLGEVIDACCAYVENPGITTDEIIENHIPGPDFPTGAYIMGRGGAVKAYRGDRGSVIMRAKTTVEEIRKDRYAIIVHEVPYQVNKARMVENIADAVRDKRVEGVSDLRDESDRDGVRVVIELKRDAEPEVVLNQMFRHSPMQTSFGVNMLALHEGRPQVMDLRTIIAAFVDFREQVIRRRTIFELRKARERAHVLAGLAVAVANIDEVIALIRKAQDPAEARAQLMARAWPAGDVAAMIALLDEPGYMVSDKGTCKLSEAQARAILELRLHRLTGLERDKIGADLAEIAEKIRDYLDILGSRTRLMNVLTTELLAIKEQFATPRRTEILDQETDYDDEDLIQRDDMVITVTGGGYIKRVPLSTYRAQNRGGKGRTAMKTHDEDYVSQVFVADTLTPMLFFSSTGMVYKKKAYKLPLGAPQARGRALVNLLPLAEGETITTVMPWPEEGGDGGETFIAFATKLGNVRRNRLSDFERIQANGKIAMKMDSGDELVRVRTCTESDDFLLSAASGKCVRFPVTDVRVFAGRTSTGVRGMRLKKDDVLIAMSALRHVEATPDEREHYLQAVHAQRRLTGGDYTERPEQQTRDKQLAARLSEPRAQDMARDEQFILAITADGIGKRTSAYEYRIMGRGGQGVVNIDTARKTGGAATVIAAFCVEDSDQIIMVTDGGQFIRTKVDQISVVGRAARGVTLFKVAKDEKVVSVSRLKDVGEDGGEDGGEESDEAETADESANESKDAADAADAADATGAADAADAKEDSDG
ncbi:MAG: DNA gyrase subunit A [Rhodospirillales bacterium]